MFMFDPSLTSGRSAALMQGHWLRRRPDIKQHMSDVLEFHRKYHRELLPHFTRHESYMRQGWINVLDSGPTLNLHFVGKLMNMQYLNHPPYPNRWMITLIQQGIGLLPRVQRALLSGRWCWPVSMSTQRLALAVGLS